MYLLKTIGFVVTLWMLNTSTTLASPVNINTADAQTIADALTNIGLKKAEAIVAYRTKIGGFKTIDQLSEVSGIGEKTIEMNKADILLTDTGSAPAPADVKSPPNKK